MIAKLSYDLVRCSWESEFDFRNCWVGRNVAEVTSGLIDGIISRVDCQRYLFQQILQEKKIVKLTADNNIILLPLKIPQNRVYTHGSIRNQHDFVPINFHEIR